MRKDAPGPGPGFSLVELMAALAVAAILLGLALPGFQETVRRHRAEAAVHQLSTMLALARNTAIVRRTPVTVCPSLGGGQCHAKPDWSSGWLVYRDPHRASQPASPADVLQEVRMPLHGSVRAYSSAGRLRVRYQPDGLSSGTNLTIRVCNDRGVHAELVVNNTGRVRVSRPSGPPAACPAPD